MGPLSPSTTATEPALQGPGAAATEAQAPESPRSATRRRAPPWRAAPCQPEKSPSSTQDPARPKLNRKKFLKRTSRLYQLPDFPPRFAPSARSVPPSPGGGEWLGVPRVRGAPGVGGGGVRDAGYTGHPPSGNDLPRNTAEPRGAGRHSGNPSPETKDLLF